MALQYRTIRAAVSALLIAVAMGAGGMTGMASALAAEPPVDVVLDATVTVNLIPSTHTSAGVVGALVRLEAYRTEGEPFQTLETASTDGLTATFDGVARAASGAPDVLLDVSVAFSFERTDELGCIERGDQSGSTNGIVSGDGLAIDVDNWASSILLPDCTGVADLDDGVVTVRFTDQLTLLPVAGAGVTISVSHPALEGEEGAATETLTGTTDADGVATIDGVPHRPHDLPGVELDIRAHKVATWTDAASGCTGSDTWDAARVGVVGAAAVDIAFTGDEQSAASSIECGPNSMPSGGVAGATGTPGTGGNAGLTPPPTDAVALRVVAQPDRLGPALTLGFLIGLIAAALVLSPRPGSRRRR
ncbi:MAG: hypothetical protein H0U52_10705 [Chloroflexi bacterium]|nr:hypothetical protein [Chloroflexota bacterium]